MECRHEHMPQIAQMSVHSVELPAGLCVYALQVISNTFYRSAGSTGFWYAAVGTSQGYVCVEATAFTGICENPLRCTRFLSVSVAISRMRS